MWIEIEVVNNMGGVIARSPSARKVWIEINVIIQNTQRGMSPSARKVWIEMATLSGTSLINGSPSARKVWIEI